ncbi:MAG: 5'-nucleotidase C-terminal domain-containing protein, partial [Candidatus Spyradocola sp.]
MNGLKRIVCVLLAILMLVGLVGCTGAKPAAQPESTPAAEDAAPSPTVQATPASRPEEGDKVEITMYLWDKNMTRNLTPWLEEQFPDISFTFVVGYNTMAYYTDMTSRGMAMPDIITCRRFSLNDAAHLSDQLLDLSQTEIVGTFYSSYIENNRELDGGIRWLPMCAEVDGYVANVGLFEQYGIPLPTNYAEFVDAIDRFEAEGVRGFATDWNADYTCLENLQGASIPALMSLEGTMWRMEYESEVEDGMVALDDVVWPQVFERFEQYLKDIHITPEEAERDWSGTIESFRNGEIAMIRATANDCAISRTLYDENYVMLPYFGETEADNWVLTYPMCQVAVAKTVGEDDAKKDAIMRVLNAMFSEDGQRALASGSAVLSYNRNINIETDDSLVQIQSCIERNHLYIRLASTEIFSISRDVVRRMITGELDAKAAYDEFNAQLTTVENTDPAEVLFTQNEGYAYAYGDNGCPAASSLLNTMRAGTGDDVAIGYSTVVSEPVFAGDYTEQQLKWLIGNKTIAYRGEYTGAEVRRFMEWLVNADADGSNPVRHYNNLPVTSGLQYTVTANADGTYALGDLTIDGAQLDDSATYTLLLLGEDVVIEDDYYCGCPMPEDLKARRKEQNESNVRGQNVLI